MRSLAEMLPATLADELRKDFQIPDLKGQADETSDDFGEEPLVNATAVGSETITGQTKINRPVIELVVQNVKGMKKWHFRQGDADHFPSVPHGHENNMDWPVCDPYTGRVYDGEREELQSNRLSRKVRIALWKDPKFRAFALKTIIWHETAFPYRPIRVKRPHRLPRIFRH